MDDSSSFSSLLALVDDHLSKTLIQATDSRSDETGNNASPEINIPSLQLCTRSESSVPQLSRQGLPLPSFRLSRSPTKNVIAEQLANMLKAKEKKAKEEEEERLRKEMESMKLKEDSDCVVDLMKALTPVNKGMPLRKIDTNISSSSSMEFLFEPQLIDFPVECVEDKMSSPAALLPCSTDLSYILKQKVPKGKCSRFGKVLISRYKTMGTPYFREKMKSEIVRFQFKTKSPCDLIKEKLRKTEFVTLS